MSSNWAHRFTRWRPHYLDGVRYDLSHLHPFHYELRVPAHRRYPARTLDIRVAFSAHCFTQSCPHGFHDPPFSPNHRDLRRFCPERHGLSRLLPRILRELDSRRIYFNFKNSQQRNYITIELPDGFHKGSEYLVFFDVRAMDDANAILVFVETAFPSGTAPKPTDIGRRRVGFRVLINLALQGRKPRPPAT